jgi:hypothetical protein
MFYTEKEKQEMLLRDKIFYAEEAHKYPCCGVPTIHLCLLCSETNCKNKVEINNLKKWLNLGVIE